MLKRFISILLTVVMVSTLGGGMNFGQPQGEKSVLHIYLSTYFLIFYRQGRARNIRTPFVSFRYKDRDKKGGRRYIIPDTIYKISERPADYTLSSGLRRFSPIFRKWLGVSPVTFLNWALKWAVLE